jgi:nucleoside-triphosphatase
MAASRNRLITPFTNLLITGVPGIGKTTLIQKLSEELRNLNPVGFYTTEIREKAVRKGFELVSLDGKRAILSHTEIRSPHRVGKYKVDVEGFEAFLDTIPCLLSQTRCIIVDEIGKMECLSNVFRKVMKEILDSEKLVIATIAWKGSGFIEEIKKRDDAELYEMTQDNRDSLLSEIIKDILNL